MVDPRAVRLSKHVRLSDLMGCHSIFAQGYPNIWDDPGGKKLIEAENLAQTVLEPLLRNYGPMSISYGYISPQLSREIVKYQDPDKPSYHRYDDGAAADVCVHRWVQNRLPKSAPILLAHEIDRKGPPYSRMITYSESPYICMASRVAETHSKRPRQAFYENRYMGKKGEKPIFVTMSKDMLRRREQRISAPQTDWRGAGYPTYHGGGRKQVHHIRVSKYTMLSDWLFNVGSLKHGIKNIPTQSEPIMNKFKYVGDVYDRLIDALDVPKLSITQGWAGPSLRMKDYDDFHWTDERFAFIVGLPQGFSEDEFVIEASHIEGIDTLDPVGDEQWLVVGRFA